MRLPWIPGRERLPPNLTIPTQNALAISTHFVIPIAPDYLSAIGIGLLLNRIKELGEALERSLTCSGIVIGRVGRNSRHREETKNAVRDTFTTAVIKGEITERSVVAESAEKHVPVFKMNNSDATAEFTAVYDELLERLELKK